ncbi:MAG: hypothetical protein M3R07_02375 [Gemmatimonadota bacterium]|nr:hypothetical protein [Gemmatimonadota bacterium]
MPSPDSARRSVEHLLRSVSAGLLVWMLWLSLDRSVPVSAVSARSGALTKVLREQTIVGIAPDRIDVRLDSAPTPRERDWLAALGGSGSAVRWSGTVAASGITVRPVVTPGGGLSVMVAAPERTVVLLGDELGAIDSVSASGTGASFGVPAATGLLTARVNGTAGSALVTDSVTIRRLLVVGAAGWESKFVIAALEEDGWKVDADIRVAPGASVSQGMTAPIDTSRYAALIVLDASSAARAAEISAYARSGGGVVLAGRAASADAFAGFRAGIPGNVMSPTAMVSTGPTTQRTLSLAPILSMRADAVTLDRRGSATGAAARRHGAGRVLQHGYVDTWRWRMSGGDNSVAEHRRWWTLAVASVAYAPRIALQNVQETDAAPLAALTAALGPPSVFGSADDTRDAGDARSMSRWWMFALLSVSLILEIASRRLRGAK